MNDAKRLAASLASSDGSEELRELFLAIDTDGDGKLTQEEWAKGVASNKELVQKLLGSSRSEQELFDMFSCLAPDAQAEGVTWESFLRNAASLRGAVSVAELSSTEGGVAELQRLFDSIDSDSNGTIDIDEWSQGLVEHNEFCAKVFGGPTNIADASALFKRLDDNRDGVLTWEEFKAGAARFRQSEEPQS